MQYFLLSTIAIPFLWINYKIVKTDIKEKKIPNKLLWYLLFILPFFYSYNFYYFDINYLFFFFSIILTFLVSFILYYFWIWSAWDAKYLLVLALFIPQIWIIPFIWNIALLTILYLLWYFIWFYFWKCLFNWKYTKSLYSNIYNDLKDKSHTFLKSWDGNFYKKIMFLKILKWILLFLIIFVSIRLARLYLIADIVNSPYYNNFKELFLSYSSYIILLLTWSFIWLIYVIKYTINKIKYKLVINWIEYKENYIIAALLLILIHFIIYEYLINPLEIRSYLFRIFTIYILFYLIFKILKYSYKITFQLAEQETIHIKDLKVWDIIDHDYLVKMFGEQSALWAYWHKWILEPNPKDYFTNLKNPIDNETIKNLFKIYKVVNNYHKKKSWTLENNSIKVLKTFAFGWYIFIWFIISFLIWNMIFQIIINFIIWKIFHHI
jgi:Flp pilus assembly protein protease CpaA